MQLLRIRCFCVGYAERLMLYTYCSSGVFVRGTSFVCTWYSFFCCSPVYHELMMMCVLHMWERVYNAAIYMCLSSSHGPCFAAPLSTHPTLHPPTHQTFLSFLAPSTRCSYHSTLQLWNWPCIGSPQCLLSCRICDRAVVSRCYAALDLCDLWEGRIIAATVLSASYGYTVRWISELCTCCSTGAAKLVLT